MKNKFLSIIFALNCTISLNGYMHCLITYESCPKSILEDPCSFSSYFIATSTAEFGRISLTFELPCIYLFVVYTLSHNDGSILFIDKFCKDCFIEYFKDNAETFQLFKKSIDDFLGMVGTVDIIEDTEDMLI